MGPMPDLAAFDLDGTLTEGGSVFDFLAAVAGRREVAAASASLSPALARAALAGGTAADDTKERLFRRVLAGVEVTRLDEVARQFAEDHLRDHLRADVHRRFGWHRHRGDRLVIVSASPEAYVGPIGDRLGADHVVATRLEVVDGRLTGGYDGRNCRGEEKLTRLQAWRHGLDDPGARLWAYGNSRGDLRMLAAADVGVNVGRLGPWGRLRAYPGLAASETRPAG
jgi:phosphatidylglycerophosphatase C